MNWIKVSADNLPSDGAVVLAYWPGMPGGRDEFSCARLVDGCWMSADEFEDMEYSEPSHWMPLKAPQA